MKNPFVEILKSKEMKAAEEERVRMAEQKRKDDEEKRLNELSLLREVVVMPINQFLCPMMEMLRDAAYPYHKLDVSGYRKVYRNYPCRVDDTVTWTIHQWVSGGMNEYVREPDIYDDKVIIRLEFYNNSQAVKYFSCWTKGRPKFVGVDMTEEAVSRMLVALHPPSEFG